MIIRVFRARAKPDCEARFEAFLRNTGAPLVQAQDGLLGMYVGRPYGERSREFVFVSIWRDAAGLKRWLGEHWNKPLIHPEESELIEEAGVRHYEGIETAGGVRAP